MSIRRRILPKVGGSLLAGLLALGLVPAAAQAHPGHEQDPEFRALLFTKTAGYRHDSIPAGVAMFEQLAADNHFEVDHTEDSAVFNDAALATYDVVIMFQTSGMVWQNDAERAAIQKYVEDGGGIAAIHNATDMGIENEFPWWDELVNAGTHMPSHSPGVLPGTAKVVDKQHPSTAGLPERWNRAEEWYNFDKSIRGKAHVLVTADEQTYNPGQDAMGADHPISWCRDVGTSRVWSTAMGHPIGSYSEPEFVKHLLGGVRTAAKVVPADCAATVDTAFEKVPLDTNTKAPTAMDIAPDGRVFYTEILGQVKLFSPATGGTTTALDLPVYSGGEDGLVGLTLDPNFADNGWVYLYYSPPGTEEINRVSRFTVEGDVIVPGSESKLLDIPASRREEPGHTGGYLTFGPTGDLYIGVGDDTNPFASSGYSPIDERVGRELFDAQKTSANTNDLRGKILRVTPKAEGGYTVPEGNMFAPGTDKTLPEIYAMGFRNSFRFSVDTDGTIYAADYGPDARTADPNRGPDGQVEWNVIKEPGFYGWPYCTGNNIPYNDFDFATSTSGPKFDCANVVNTSPNNTGLTQLPPSKVAEVWYGYGPSENFPELGEGGSAPMAGPVYRFDPNLASDVKFPQYYDGKAFFYEWARNKVYTFSSDSEGKILEIAPWFASQTTLAPMDMRFGPDGAMYLLEWGGGYGRDNPDSGLYRIEHTQGNRSPLAKATASPTSGQTPLEVSFSSAGSVDPEGTDVTFSWTFGDGATSTEANPTHTYAAKGAYNAQLTVTDSTGKSGVANITVTVGNTAPTVDVAWPVEGGMFDFGDTVAFDVNVTDPEDGAIDCAAVVVQPALGHDSHGHPLDPINACEGQFQTIVDDGHADANILYSVDASYTDKGTEGVPALNGRDTAVLQPKHKQAEFFTGSSGIRIVSQAGAESGRRIGDINGGDWISFKPVNFTGIDQVSLRASAPDGAGGSVELRAGAVDGALLANVPVPSTGGWDNYVQLPPVDLADFEGTTELFMVFRGGVGPFDLDSMKFIGNGVAVVDAQAPKTTAAFTAADGVNGWYRTTPTVTLTADDGAGSGVAGTEYRIGDGAWTPYTAPFTVPGEGEQVIAYRSTDKKGNVEAEGSSVLKIDAGAPALTVSGVQAGGSYGDSEVLGFAWEAGDPVSGLDTAAAVLDGKPVANGAPVALHTLSLGAHELVVTAKDKAGNVVTQKFGFTVTTSLTDVRALVEEFTAAGKIDQFTAAQLKLTLTTAKFLQDKNSPQGAAAVLSLFKHTVERKVADPAVRAVLVRDAQALIDGLRA
ncbi:ThuA domain-containing protein [Amycolatopsis magusensis]|uniref:ThuA domain-containing protein n=1 Tax=Amycolatopsis magusensis TaxID=882444 RepID=UPI0024A952B3|nr:ThuA domain-containing protein [Amycolatopsis magusensis]MDI5977553.1 ThuA domain-containing protein [Amycolatopsis magusensis]